ncbi:MAG: hypothetical protein QOD99_2619 [Chthoniobacter sp.]|nr:hypothetical protein [Chthoniobacter sp.]
MKTSPEPLQIELAAEKSKISAAATAAAQAGLAAFGKDDMKGARIQFQKLLALAPENLTALVNLGSVEYRLHHNEEAEKLLKRAVRLNPDAGLAWLTLGVVYNEQNKSDAALASLSQAVLLEPKNARAHNALAATLWRKGWYLGAEDELKKTVELDPDFADAHFNLALVYLRRTPPAIELARRHYQRARDLGAAADAGIEKQLAAVVP